MKISPVTLRACAHKSSNGASKNNKDDFNPTNTLTPRSCPVFKGKESPGFFEKLSSFFKKPQEPQTPSANEEIPSFEEQADDEIREVLTQLDKAHTEYKKIAKEDFKLLQKLVRTGAKKDYKGYIPYGDDGVKLLFGDFAKDGLPTKVNVISFNDGLKPEFTFEFANGSNCFSVENYYDNFSRLKMDIIDKEPVQVEDLNAEDKIWQRMIFAGDTTYYILAELNRSREPGKITTIVNFDKANPKEAFYIDLEGEEEYGFYRYNEDDDFWEREKTISPEEIPKYLNP